MSADTCRCGVAIGMLDGIRCDTCQAQHDARQRRRGLRPRLEVPGVVGESAWGRPQYLTMTREDQR